MKKILLIEDDRRVSQAIGISLKAMGYQVATGSDAVSAAAQARKFAPDVVVLDLNLPGGDGFTVAERLQQLTETAAVPIIFITASKQEGLHERARAAGASRLLEKPFGITELAEAIESAHTRFGTPLEDLQIG